MRPIHKRPDGGFLFAVAAVLFLAVCAWGGAELYARLRPPSAVAASGEEAFSVLPLTGLALRREEPLVLPADAVILPANGSRLPAEAVLARLSDGTAVRARQSCLFFADVDGLEALGPLEPELLSVGALRSLLAREPEPYGSVRGRLVYEETWYFAALAAADAALPPPGPCRLRFSPRGEWLEARLLAVSAPEDGETALLFRLDRGGEYLSLRRCEAELAVPAG